MTNSDLRIQAATRLQNGRLILTATSKKTGDHITLRFRCKNRDLRQRYVNLAEAKIIGVDAGRVREDDSYKMADMVGYIFADKVRAEMRADHTQFLQLTPNAGADEARLWLANHLLNWIKGLATLNPSLELRFQNRCSRCGRELSDPESIDRTVGPECYNVATSSHHQVKGLLVDTEQMELL